MAAQKSSAPHACPSTEEQDDTVEAHYACLERPHACLDGYVYLGYTAIDEKTGEVIERVEALPCRRCAEEAR